MGTLLRRLKAVPELSAEEALAALGGAEAPYERLLLLSARVLPEHIDNMNRQIISDFPGYAITVHGVKSALNGIGAYELGKKALELEKLAKADERDMCRELQGAFTNNLNVFLDHMNDVFGLNESRVQGDVRQLKEILPELRNMVRDYDGRRARDIASALLGYTFGSIADEAIKALVHCLDHFDFDGAAAQIEAIAALNE